VFGPSTPGALNVVAGQSNGVSATLNVFSTTTPITLLHPTHEAWGDDAKIQKNISVIGDGDPLTDVCSNGPRPDDRCCGSVSVRPKTS